VTAAGLLRTTRPLPAFERRFHATSLLLEAIAPLGFDDALAALARQATLAVPVKVMRGHPGGSALLAEIPFEGDLERCRRDAGAALDAALAWLARGPAAVESTEDRCAALEEAVATLGWTMEAGTDGEFAARTSPPGAPLRIRALAGGALRVAHLATALRVPDARSGHAVRLLALEANAWLRLARLGVSGPPAGVLHVERDVILPAGITLERWLGEAAHALDAAQRETGRALRALATPEVAAAYLAARGVED